MPRTIRAGQTAIGEALLARADPAGRAPAVAGTEASFNVIGDGRSNDGIAPGPIRDRMAAADITINGLCILHEEPDLLEIYTNEVIGGPGAFAVDLRALSGFCRGDAAEADAGVERGGGVTGDGGGEKSNTTSPPLEGGGWGEGSVGVCLRRRSFSW